jgi:hypothetical protein
MFPPPTILTYLDIVDKCQYYLVNTGPSLDVFALSRKRFVVSIQRQKKHHYVERMNDVPLLRKWLSNC